MPNSLEPRAILNLDIDESAAETLLGTVGFTDKPAARARLMRIAGNDAGRQTLGDCLPGLFLALSETANPDHALINFERFAQSVADRVKLFGYLREHPRAIEILVRLFVGSQFLTEILLCNPAYLERLTQHQRLADLKSVQQLRTEAQGAMLGIADMDEKFNALRRFQRWELLRIGMCDFCGLLDLRRVTVQLSLLADSLVQACLNVAYENSEVPERGFVVIAMGKLGGEELNYSSDIDLLFLAESNSNAYWRIAQRMIKGLTNATADGFLYRVDMRLRPWGRAGELVSTLDSHVGYLMNNAQLWEKQALLKARVIAGDVAVGKEFLRRAVPLLFNTPLDTVRASVRGMKDRIEADLHKKGRFWGEVKLGRGSIRDIEFLVQYLQLVHGGTNKDVRSFNTLDALVRLTDCGFLHADEYRLLTDGYVFLRTIEHSLQLMHNEQTHELPDDRGELTYLARRLDFANERQFITHYQRHCEAVRMVYERYLGAQDKARPPEAELPKPSIRKHLSRMERSYSETFSEAEIEKHALLAAKIDDDHPVVVEAEKKTGGEWRVTIVGYDYLGELSLICGLMLVHGLSIAEGHVFTYEPLGATGAVTSPSKPRRKPVRRGANRPEAPSAAEGEKDDVRQKIVDVFTVRPTREIDAAELWPRYTADLTELLQQLRSGQHAEAQGALVKRVAKSLRHPQEQEPATLYPIGIEIDNAASNQYTVLHIVGRDTLGFLYELTNALALSGVYIARVSVESAGETISDTLYVTDAGGQKIIDTDRQHELQAATVLIKHFTHLLARSPNPESALLHFREFVSQLFTRPDWTEEISTLERPDVLEALAQLLGVSDFLWNDFLRMQHANLFPVVRDVGALARGKSKATLAAELDACLASAPNPEARRAELNAFKDREMFRVDMRHILGHIAEFGQFSAELADVAEVVVAAAYQLCDAELRLQFGDPQLTSAPRIRGGEGVCPLAVCALGKCGGRELGFASDIELMFVYEGEGKTTGPQVIATAEFFIKLVENVTHAIRARREGIFEIDLRLRPYGRGGSMAVSLDAFREYFGPSGAAWPFERQALVKLRPIAGDADFGARLVALRDELIYTGAPFDIAAMRGMRERQIRQLVVPGTVNAKLGPGGLVDAEYLVQGLQITHGHRDKELRATNTFEAMTALRDAGVLSRQDFEDLSSAYIFLRRLIDALRVVRGNAKDLTIPAADSEEFAFLARRLGYETDIGLLRDDVGRHMTNVRDLSARLLEGRST